MEVVKLTIDGKEARAPQGATVLEAVRSVGADIPTLCHHERLRSYGGCRICVVEVETRGRFVLDTACTRPVQDGMVVRTRSAKVDGTRKLLLELLLARAPDSPRLRELGREYGADADRFEKEASFCIHCGLCVRYCAEVRRLNAVGFVDRGIRKEIRFVPDIASRECDACRECFPLCPTSYLQAAFVLVEALAPADVRSAEPRG